MSIISDAESRADSSYLSLKGISLRAVEPEDANIMWEFDNDSSQWPLVGIAAPFSRENMRQYALTYDADPFRAGQLRLMVDYQDKTIGILDIYDISAINRTGWLGIYIAPHARRCGHASAAIKIAARYAAAVLNIKCLAAKISSANPGSVALFKRAGFLQCGVLSGWLHTPDGSSADLLLFQSPHS